MLAQIPASLVNPLGVLSDEVTLRVGRLFRKKSRLTLGQYSEALDLYFPLLTRGLEGYLDLPVNLERRPVVHTHSSENGYQQSILKATIPSPAAHSKTISIENARFPLSILRHDSKAVRPLILCLHGFLMEQRPHRKNVQIEAICDESMLRIFPGPFMVTALPAFIIKN